ncbi:MAG: hypothetical protein K9G62_01855, partial [Alphaproteobacteria bacterium]|nr:hypothetical protein [Alphaproteobacteria bacterium]
MADQAGARKDISNQPGLEEPTGADLSASPRADRVSALREKIIVPKSGGFKKETDESASILAETRRLSETLFGDTPRPGQAPEESEEPILLLKPVNAAPVFSASGKTMKIIYPMAALVSGLWLGFCIFHLLRGGLPADPQTLGTLLAGMFAPPAMLWMALGTFSRRAEMNLHASALRAELHSILFPSPENAQRINRDVERLCAQAAEISTNSRAVLKSLHRARQGLHTEIREFSSLSKKAEFSIDRLAQSLTDRAENLLSLTEEIEQRTAHIDEKARAGAEAWDRATLSVLDRAGEMESAMGRGADKILKAADKAGSEMKQAEQALEEAEKRMGAALSVRSAAVSEVSAVLSADLEKMDSTLNGQIEKLAAGALETSQRLNLLKDALAQTALAAEPLYTRLSEKAHGAKTDIQAVRAALEEVESTQMPILERMGSALGDQVRILKDSVENADRVLSQSGTQVQGLAQTALEAASQIRNAGDIFADRTQELQDYMVESLNMAEAYHGELKTRIEELSEKAVKSATRMDQAVSSLGGHMETIGKTAAAA